MPPVERHIQVNRTARYYVAGDLGVGTRELWVACHGYSQLAAPFLDALAPLSHPTRVIVAPEALSRFYLDEPAKRHGPDSPVGASWMTREDRESEIANYVAYLDAVAAEVLSETRGSVRVVAFGFSQAVATVCRWAALGATKVDRVILWGGAIAADLPAGRGAQLFRGAPVTMITGRKDTVVPVSFLQKEARALEALGAKVELMEHDGGHSLNSGLLRILAQ